MIEQYAQGAANSTKPRSARSGRARRRLPALDGLRGTGIAAVVAYHLDPSWLPGGYLGVDVFFVVSGFLITGLLFDLLGRAPRPGPALRQFWSRRARRLVPALVVMVSALCLVAGAVAHDAMPRLRGDIPAALGFVANWRLLFHHDSYFESVGRPPLLLHLWSLGVEEQFYLVWPLVVLLVLRWSRRPARAVGWVAGIGALCSAALMAALFVPGHDASAVYYDTFTHSAGLMIGAGLAAATYHRRLVPDPAGARPRAIIGTIALASLAMLMILMGADSTFAYRGGILAASALTALAISVGRYPGPVQRALSMRPLRYLGTRSYSLYLWHWPIICLTRPTIDVPFSGWELLVLRLALIGVVAEASYRLVEQPFRTGRAQEALRALRGAGRTVAVGSMGLCAGTAAVVLATVNPPALPAAMAIGSTPAARLTLVPATTTPTTQLRTPTSAPAATVPVTRIPVFSPTTFSPTTAAAARTAPTTVAPTTVAPTTVAPTTVAPTTVAPTTAAAAPTTVAPTTVAPTTVAPTTAAAAPTTVAPTTVAPTTVAPTTVAPTTVAAATTAPTTAAPATVAPTTSPGLPSSSTSVPTGPPPTPPNATLAPVHGLAHRCVLEWGCPPSNHKHQRSTAHDVGNRPGPPVADGPRRAVHGASNNGAGYNGAG